MSRTCVYQAFNAEHALLYVGLSKHWPSRWTAHSKRAPWWSTVARLEVIWLPGLYEALWYEGHLIRTAHPKYNKHIPKPLAAPDRLSTQCTLCPTSYSVSWRPPGSQCEDLSLKPWTEQMTESELLALGCKGICELISTPSQETAAPHAV